MSLFDSFFGWFGMESVLHGEINLSSPSDSVGNEINPASGLPMIGGMGGVDVEGNPFGMDLSHDHGICTNHDDGFTTIRFDD